MKEAPQSRFPDSRLAETHAAGWRATYEIWNLDSRTVILRYTWTIDTADMALLLYNGMTWLDWDIGPNLGPKFGFPAAISPNLRRFVAAAECIDIVEVGARGTSVKRTYIRRRLIDCPAPPYQRLTPDSHRVAAIIYHPWFSADGEHLLTLRTASGLSTNPDTTFCPKDWALRTVPLCHIGCREILTPSDPLPIECFLPQNQGIDYRCYEDFARIFCFHPSLPLLVVSSQGATYLWNMAHPGMYSLNTLFPFPQLIFPDRVVSIINRGLLDTTFSACGRYLYGRLPTQMIALDLVKDIGNITRHLSDERKSLEYPWKSSDRYVEEVSETIAQTAGKNAGSLIERLAANSQPKTQSTGEILFRSKDGAASMSMLNYIAETGAVNLISLNSDGAVTVETMSRVPETIVDAEMTITPCGNADLESTRLVINRHRRLYYHLGLLNEPGLPAIVERAKSSIPSVTMSTPNGKDAVDFFGGGDPKRRLELRGVRVETARRSDGNQVRLRHSTWEAERHHAHLVPNIAFRFENPDDEDPFHIDDDNNTTQA